MENVIYIESLFGIWAGKLKMEARVTIRLNESLFWNIEGQNYEIRLTKLKNED